MTDQKTPLKTKAKTLEDWYDDYEKLPNGLSDKKYIKELTKKLVLLSDAEPLELENQQLKKELSKEQHYKNEWKHQFLKIAKLNTEFAKQIETVKTILNNELKRSQDELESAKTNRKWDIKYWKGRKDSIEKLLLEKEVFGEKTET